MRAFCLAKGACKGSDAKARVKLGELNWEYQTGGFMVTVLKLRKMNIRSRPINCARHRHQMLFCIMKNMRAHDG